MDLDLEILRGMNVPESYFPCRLLAASILAKGHLQSRRTESNSNCELIGPPNGLFKHSSLSQ